MPRLLALLVSIPLALASHEPGGAQSEGAQSAGGIIIGVIIAAFVVLLVACVLWKSRKRRDDMSYISTLLAVSAIILQTGSALCVSLLSFRCASCYMNLLVSSLVIMPIQCIAWILGVTGCGLQLSLRRDPSCSPCCGSTTCTVTASVSLNVTSICFLVVGFFTMIMMHGNYNTAREGPAVVIVLCFAEIVRIVMLVACMICAPLPFRQTTTSPQIAVGVALTPVVPGTVVIPCD